MEDLRLPPELDGIFFPFRWNRAVLWNLPTPARMIPIESILWHLDLPVWSTRPPDPLFDLRPNHVITFPEKHKGHWQRIVNVDQDYALEMFEWNGRWVIMDGFHRLAKHRVAGSQHVAVRQHHPELLKSVIVR